MICRWPARQRDAQEAREDVGRLAVGQSGVLVEVNDQGLGLGTDLTGGGSGGVAGLQGMTAAQTPTALPALGRSECGCGDAAAWPAIPPDPGCPGAFRRPRRGSAGRRRAKGRRDARRSGHRPGGGRWPCGSVLIAGLAARSSGVGLGSLLGEGGGLAFGLTLGGLAERGSFHRREPGAVPLPGVGIPPGPRVRRKRVLSRPRRVRGHSQLHGIVLVFRWNGKGGR